MAVYSILVTLLLITLLAIGLFARTETQREISRLELQLAAAQQALLEQAEIGRNREELVANVSHELRTPLTSISGALSLFAAGFMGTFDVKAQNLLRIAVTNTDRLFRLVNDLLDLERIKSGRATLQLARCSLNDIVHQAIESVTIAAHAAQITLAYHPPPTPLYLDADPHRLLQVLLNLLANAIKFSPPESAVEVIVSTSPEMTHLRVVDQGRGIPADQLDTVFNRFQQVEARDAHAKGGSGLGLAISRGIIHQHGGTIWAERNPTSGSTFCIDLPRHARASDPLPAPETPSPPSTTIIICDQDPGVRTVVAEHLLRRGYAVREASSGEETVKLASGSPIGAILIDFNNSEAMQRLQTRAPIIVLSALSAADHPALPFKPQGWVQKPFSEHLLLNELSRVLKASSSNSILGR